jgi:hypothetical protein
MSNNRSFIDIYSLDINNPENFEVIKELYSGIHLTSVTIDYDEFTNYGDFQFVWEKSYFEEPGRSSGGVIEDLDTYPTFVVPHLKIRFDIMSLDDYRRLIQIDLLRNEHTVTFFDPIFNRITRKKMYFAPSELKKLWTIQRMRQTSTEWENFLEIAGAEEVTVELIGTNSDSSSLTSVTYYSNIPSGAQTSPNPTNYITHQIKESSNFRAGINLSGNTSGEYTDISITQYTVTLNGVKYEFSHWSTSATGGYGGIRVEQGESVFMLPGGMSLYAQWKRKSVQ